MRLEAPLLTRRFWATAAFVVFCWITTAWYRATLRAIVAEARLEALSVPACPVHGVPPVHYIPFGTYLAVDATGVWQYGPNLNDFPKVP